MPACLRCRTLVDTKVLLCTWYVLCCSVQGRLKAVLLCLRYVDTRLSEFVLWFLVFRRKAGSKTKASLFVFLGGHIAIISRADDTASIVSKKTTSPAVIITSRLVLPSAMTWTEKNACVANLPHLHTRALPAACCCYGAAAVLRSVLVLLLQLPMAVSSSLVTKKSRKKERHRKQRKQRTSGRFFSPTTNFLVGNYGLRRDERWDDMPSMSSEVGEI